MKLLALGDDSVSALGQGTWKMAERSAGRRDEIAALREGLALGMNLIDTAEMYADGAAEELVGEAIAGQRDSGTASFSSARPILRTRHALAFGAPAKRVSNAFGPTGSISICSTGEGTFR